MDCDTNNSDTRDNSDLNIESDQESPRYKMSESEGNTYVATVVRDDFFNDPFFKDWWADFDVPMAALNRNFNRQISGQFFYVSYGVALLSSYYDSSFISINSHPSPLYCVSIWLQLLLKGCSEFATGIFPVTSQCGY